MGITDKALAVLKKWTTKEHEPGKMQLPTPKERKTQQHTHAYNHQDWYQHARDLPLFTFQTVREMLRDPQVRLCLAMRSAPIFGVEFAYVDGIGQDGKPNWVPGVKARNPIVAAWVQRQLQTIWNSFLQHLLESQTWGWAGGEVTLRLSETNLIEIDALHPRHPKDIRLLELNSCGNIWGIQVSNVVGEGIVKLPFPYAYFVRFRPQNGEKYSSSVLVGAYSPWADKWLNGAALDTRRLYMHKDAYGGMRVGYPSDQQVYVNGPDRDPVPARDVALQIAEQRYSGGTVVYPTDHDMNGNEKWKIEDATVASNPQHILQYPKDLDNEIRQGLEIPDGAISNDGSGAWEGKSIPLAAFFSGIDTWVTQILADIRMTLDPLVLLNWGKDEEYEITHKPLGLQAMEQQGAKRDGNGALGPVDPMQQMQMDQQSDPYRMSLDPVDAVGRGALQAKDIVKAARTALGYDTEITTMAAMRAPKGYTKENPLVINGQEYHGGMFIPGSEIEHASKEQLEEIKSGVKKDAPGESIKVQPKSQTAPRFDVEKGVGSKHDKFAKLITANRQLKLKSGDMVRVLADSRTASAGYMVRLTKSDKTKIEPSIRFNTHQEASDYAAELLIGHKADSPKASASRPAKATAPAKVIGGERNWRYESTEFFSKGKKSKYKDNVEALRVLKDLRLEDRTPTKEEQATISKWVGWGQMPELFDYRDNAGYSLEEYHAWEKERTEIKAILSKDEYRAARASTINGHYTHPNVIKANWDMAKRLGFKGGRMLEPAVGGGYYLGFMPKDLADKTHVTAVEMDLGSAEITSQLYPDADIFSGAFQDFRSPANFYDLVATNVPFSNKVQVFNRKYKITVPIHDYYFLRSLETTKPGGLIMNITSTGTMDKLSPKVREILDQESELVSAIRFPSGAHKDNAGTEVVTDMLILRKKNTAIPDAPEETPADAEPKQPGFTGTTTDSLGRLYHWVDGKRVPGPRWDDIVEVPDPLGGDPIKVNRYFQAHPEQVLGTLDRSGTMYAGNQKNVSMDEDYAEQLQAAIARLPENVVQTEAKSTEANEAAGDALEVRVTTDQDFHQGQFVEKDGKLFQYDAGTLKEMKVGKDEERVKAMIAIKDKARSILRMQHRGDDSTEAQKELNSLYDAFIAKNGPLNSVTNRKAMAKDPDKHFLQALENYNSSTKEASKADIFSKVTIQADAKATSAKNITDATGIVLNETGTIQIQRMATLLGVSPSDIEEQLPEAGLAFQDPSGKWHSSAMYLSGNTRRKLEEAKLAAITDSRFLVNVAALEKAQPIDIATEDIGVTLASPWVPPSVREAFVAHVLGGDPDEVKVTYIPEKSRHVIELNDRLSYMQSNTAVWGDFEQIMDAACNGKTITVRKQDAIDKAATDAAQAKVLQLQEQFSEWVFEDPARAAELTKLYNENNNNFLEPRFDGSSLTFPGMSKVWTERMRDLQKDFVWRVITTGKGLAAHEVGTGKTATMVAAAMELRRMGLASKPAIAVKKANIEQFAAEAQELYPGARILSLGKDFDKGDRQLFLQRIATGDYDMLIMTHENMAKMQMRPETIKKYIGEEVAELEAALVSAKKKQDIEDEDFADSQPKYGRKKAKPKRKVANDPVKQIEARKQKLEAELKKVTDNTDKDAIYFEDTGIDQLFVDEAHKFKNLPVQTSQTQVKGIPTLDSASARAMDMLARCRYLQDRNDGRGVVFATGTPITNTMAELYNMQRFLQYDQLKERGIEKFDSWASTFGMTTSDLEFKLNGEMAATRRFAKFINIPELRQLASDFMDVKRADDVAGLVRPTKHDKVIVAPSSKEMDAFMTEIQDRAKACRGGKSERLVTLADGTQGFDSCLIINNDSRSGSIDLRLVDSSMPDVPTSKANQCVDNVLKIYNENKEHCQAIFSDVGIHDSNKSGFSLFDDIKRKLIAGGIPADQIVDFSDSKLEGDKREEAQAKMRRGEVRVALGSTERLGTGTNIQKKLKALHHLDIPYVPAYLEQRDGRAYRQRNMHKNIDVYKYIQEGSADHISWQTLAKKSHFVNQFMKGDRSMRTMEDVATDDLSPEQMVAMATGNESMMKRLGVEQEVRRLKRLKSKHEQEQYRITQSLLSAPEVRKKKESRIDKAKTLIGSFMDKPFEFKDQTGKIHATASAEANAALATAVEKARNDIGRGWGVYRPLGWYKGNPVKMTDDGRLAIEFEGSGSFEVGDSLRSMQNRERQLPKELDRVQKDLENFDRDMEQLAKSRGQSFKHEAKLKDKEKELGMLIADIEDWQVKRATKMALDTSGHEHKGKGPGGGQFTKKGTPEEASFADDPKRWEARTKKASELKFSKTKKVGAYTYKHVSRDNENPFAPKFGSVWAFDASGEVVGVLNIAEDSNGLMKAAVEVAKPHRRHGVATQMYDFGEYITGNRFSPEENQSKSAEEFWKKRLHKGDES